MLRMQHSFVKNREVNCFPLSARSLLGRPYRKRRLFVKAVAMSRAVAMRKGSILERFEKRSVITSNAVLPLLNSVTRRRKSILTYFSSSVPGNSFRSLASFWRLMRSRAQTVQFFKTLYASTLIDSQQKCWRRRKSTLPPPGWPATCVRCAIWTVLICKDFGITTTGSEYTSRCSSLFSLVWKARCWPSSLRSLIYLQKGSRSCSCTNVDKTISAYEDSSTVAACKTNILSFASNSAWIKSQLSTSDVSNAEISNFEVYDFASALICVYNCASAWQSLILFLYWLSKPNSDTRRRQSIWHPDGSDSLSYQFNELWFVENVKCSHAK